jgi:hypothetical protein
MKPETNEKIRKLTIQCLDIISEELKDPPKKENGNIDFIPILQKTEQIALAPYLKANPSHKTLVQHVSREVMKVLTDSIKEATKEG